MSNLSLRLATDQDGPRIAELVGKAGFSIDGIDWTTGIYPYWIVAQNGAGIKGCISVAPCRPIGRLEMLAVDAENPHEQAKIVRMLLVQGCATLKENGAQLAQGQIPFEMRQYKRVLKKRGCVVIARGNLMAKRLV